MASASRTDGLIPAVILDELSLRQLSRRAKALLPTSSDYYETHDDVVKYVDTFHLVIETASSEALSATHQVAAWNTLSTFLDQTAAHQNHALRNLLWTARLWQKSLYTFLARGPEARPKSIKQLLGSLTSALHRTQSDVDSIADRQSTIQLLVATVLQKDNQWPVRPCLMLLSNLLRKGVFDLEHVSQAAGFNSGADCLATLLQACMKWTVIDDCASTAGQLLAVLLDQAEVAENNGPEPLWVDTLSFVLKDQPNTVDAFRLYLMPALFKRNKEGFLTLLQHFDIATHLQRSRSSGAREMTVLLAALQVGNANGLVEISPDTTIDASVCPVRLPVSTLVPLLRHADRSIRLTGLSLLIDTPSMSQPVHKVGLEALKGNLPHLHADTDLNFRSELFSLSQRLLDRLRVSTSNKAKVLQDSQPAVDALVQPERNFILWYKRFLMWELRPGASYQRHISALRCLSILMRSGVDRALPVDGLSKAAKAGGKWPFDVKIVDEDFEQVLITMILDPFDDVRQVTASLLETYVNAAADSKKQYDRLLDALHVAERKMLASGRADQADAVAYIYALLYSSSHADLALDLFLSLIVKAEHMLEAAKASLATAVKRYPLHGILTSLRYLLDKPASRDIMQEDIYNRLARLLHTIWQVVSPILCDDAPEGFLPDEIPSAAAVSSKAVLSYCWRALKEASSLTDSMLIRLGSQDHVWIAGYKSDLIELTFTQLAELRHRGAFSTVAQTWNRCCAVIGDAVSLPLLLQRVISLIQKATINTRRSAGMPSLLCGILIAGPEELLEQSFTQLAAISRQEVQQGLDDESSLPQVHAMNCLKDILKSTKLADRSERYVPVALQLAAFSLPSKAWAIRNCGLMLFRAVIDRLLGTNDSYEEDTKAKNVMDFRQRRTLLDQVLSLLPTEKHDVVLEGVFPALQLLQHSILPEDRRVEVESIVTTLLENRSWHIRDKAARTLVALIPEQALFAKSIARLNEHKSIVSSHNMLHGVLLCLKHLLRASRHQLRDVLAEEDLTEVLLLTQHFAEETRCSVLREAAQSVHNQTRGLVSEAVSASALTSKSDDMSDLMAAQALSVISNPAMADQWLLKRGSWLNRQTKEMSEVLLFQWEDYIAACTSATGDESVFSSVELAGSLCNLEAGLQLLWQSPRGRRILLKICLLIYDLLNDDDEELRLKASQVASTVLSLSDKDAMSGSFEPIIAGHKLLAFMVANYAESQRFGQECRRRAFQLDHSNDEGLTQLLGEVNSQDTDLFAEEKQNLYLDEVLEAKAWSQAARKIVSCMRKDIDDLVRKTNAALDAMITKAQSSKPDAFGWSTTEAVFPFGLRVIYAVEFLLHHVTNSGDRLSIPPSQLREKLLRFEVAAKAAGLHPLWQSELQRISKVAAVSQFSAIQSLLNGVVGHLSSATTL
ncbi:hypothetical protein AMS68_006366 [Peltaster fructicola]|uniref:Uncharacterized protein n=1 Tax=Peltaster fructicola TaxID=286661 RepID=A0A6H0Y1V5_9PEZI|nr:hypothetical protein AMS68_006366 [Peltaster fructicola]